MKHIFFILMISSQFTFAVINGSLSSYEFFARSPMVKIQTKNNGICSGVVISNKTILTAAHCIYPFDNLEAINYFTYDPKANYSTTKYKEYVINKKGISKLVVNEKYSKKFNSLKLSEQLINTKYDMGLILLKENLSSQKIQAELFQPSKIFLQELKNSLLVVAGYGATQGDNSEYSESIGIGEYTSNLKFIEENFNVSIADAFKANQNEIISLDGKQGASMCFGDSGGGLFIISNQDKFNLEAQPQELPKKWTIVGINSWVLKSNEFPYSCYKGSIHPTVFSDFNYNFIIKNKK